MLSPAELEQTEIALVNRDNHIVFQPLLADAISGSVELSHDITQLRIFHEEAVHREHFEAGESVFANEDFGDKVYFIVQGEAEVERNGERVATLHAGDIFGEVALISNQPRNATIRVSSHLDTVAVRVTHFSNCSCIYLDSAIRCRNS